MIPVLSIRVAVGTDRASFTSLTGAAATHLSRALYALSAPLPATFTSGNFRLPFSQVENRAFFLGLARQVAILHKRGTWRTGFEFAKIALGAGGGDDPVGILCWYVRLRLFNHRQY